MSGSLHPLTLFTGNAIGYFTKLGFSVIEGGEIETEWYNFDLLRVPADHPARDVQDTFWIDRQKLLRTHTTNMQGRAVIDMRIKPPLRVISPGRVFRNEATDPSHEAVINQLDGFVIDKNITMAQLMGTLEGWLKRLFGSELKVRFRPHHYPFVEPGLDIDMAWQGKWLEVIGSGLIHPEVIKNLGLDPAIYSGLAFGAGLDRLLMLKTGLKDIRLEYQNDFRFLKQFSLNNNEAAD